MLHILKVSDPLVIDDLKHNEPFQLTQILLTHQFFFLLIGPLDLFLDKLREILHIHLLKILLTHILGADFGSKTEDP